MQIKDAIREIDAILSAQDLHTYTREAWNVVQDAALATARSAVVSGDTTCNTAIGTIEQQMHNPKLCVPYTNIPIAGEIE